MPVREARIVQFGVGGVGRALLGQVLSTRERLLSHRGVHLNYHGLVDSTGWLLDKDTLGDDRLHRVLEAKARGQSLNEQAGGQTKAGGDDDILAWLQKSGFEHCVIVDTTASLEMEPVLLQAVTVGHGVVLANKRPLTASLGTFRSMLNGDRLRHEATVGAGLPIIRTIRYLLDTGDAISSIDGCLSGTMGYLCAQMEDEVPFSAALAEAKAMGYTEPDPREDLAGVDVARKALILARVLGWDLELEDVSVESLYPSDWNELSVQGFLQATERLDGHFAQRVTEAQSTGEVLRYVAEVRDRACRVGLRTVPSHSPMGGLKGSDNIVTIRSSRYDRPMTISGAGAGVEVTAAAVLEDIVDIVLTSGGTD